ncbi:MAG: hypothetical protein JWQ25_1535 [Daejeonella sp.]|nr:hypothetical protein [Daejeonella sp.]
MKKLIVLMLAALGLAFQLSAQVLVPFSTGTANHYLWGLKDATGKVVVEPKYSKYPQLYEGFAVVEINGKSGYINSKGKEITALKYDNASSYPYDGLFRVSMAAKYGFVNLTGEEVIPLIYKNANEFGSGRSLVNLEGNSFFIDKTGKSIIKLSAFEKTHEQFVSGICGVKKGGKWGFMDINGKILIPCKYDDVQQISNGFSVVVFGGKPGEYGKLKGGKWGFIDKTGKPLTPLKYAYASSFRNGPAVVNTGGILDVYDYASRGKWGYIDKTGKEITLLKYDYASEFSEGLAIVNIGGTWTNDGMGSNVMKGGKFGFVDTKGKLVIPLQYEAAESFMLGEAKVIKDGKPFSINKKGVKITPEVSKGGGDLDGDYDEDF